MTRPCRSRRRRPATRCPPRRGPGRRWSRTRGPAPPGRGPAPGRCRACTRPGPSARPRRRRSPAARSVRGRPGWGWRGGGRRCEVLPRGEVLCVRRPAGGCRWGVSGRSGRAVVPVVGRAAVVRPGS
ncbi:hypothetical protein [Ornithinimicrobium kibberense]|uniref:hypothetical protein n=1 Tax=Ornithinimicrobium kibberense TaxID=282060 RepID=UPI003612CCC4